MSVCVEFVHGGWVGCTGTDTDTDIETHRDRAYRASLSSESNRFVTAFCDDGGSGICEFVRSLVCACACVLVGVCCVCVHTSLCAFSLLACARVLVRACACMRASLCEEERVHLCLRACACLSVSHPHMHTLTHMHTSVPQCPRSHSICATTCRRQARASDCACVTHTHTHTHTCPSFRLCLCNQVQLSPPLPPSVPPSVPPLLPPFPRLYLPPSPKERGRGELCEGREREIDRQTWARTHA
jgi:hypothetical protein